MQIKDIEKLIKKNGILTLLEGADNLWIDTGYVTAPLFDFSALTEDQAYSLFNISDKERNKIQIGRKKTEPETFADVVPGEEELAPSVIGLVYRDNELLAFESSRGVILILAEHYAPFTKEDALRLFVRWLDAGYDNPVPLIAVKKGFFLRGLIEPVSGVLTQAFADTIDNLAAQTRQTVGWIVENAQAKKLI